MTRRGADDFVAARCEGRAGVMEGGGAGGGLARVARGAGAGAGAGVGATVVGVAAVLIGADAGGTVVSAAPRAVSAKVPPGGRYCPIESISSVSRFASARSAARAESAAMSSRVLTGSLFSQAAEAIDAAASHIIREGEEFFIQSIEAGDAPSGLRSVGCQGARAQVFNPR